jgi:hypothetical protein
MEIFMLLIKMTNIKIPPRPLILGHSLWKTTQQSSFTIKHIINTFITDNCRLSLIITPIYDDLARTGPYCAKNSLCPPHPTSTSHSPIGQVQPILLSRPAWLAPTQLRMILSRIYSFYKQDLLMMILSGCRRMGEGKVWWFKRRSTRKPSIFGYRKTWG